MRTSVVFAVVCVVVAVGITLFVYTPVSRFILGNLQGASTATVELRAIVPGCGNEMIESGEDCDGVSLAGATCQTKGYTSGSLSCTSSCLYDTTACVYTPPVFNSNGGGRSKDSGAEVVLSGSAYPHSRVTILKDAQVIATTIADDLAHFQVIVTHLSPGMYTFALYSEDVRGYRSAVRTFPITLTKNILAKIDSIFLAPTLAGDKVQVRRGDPIVFFGQSVPKAQVTLEVHSDQQFFVKVPAAQDGVYLYTFDSTPLELGQHAAFARSATSTIMTPQSLGYDFAVGTKNVYGSSTALCPAKGDLNQDCRVNLVDFSIAAFWYQRTLSPTFATREKRYLNGDGKINLVDFSIMAFYWTG